MRVAYAAVLVFVVAILGSGCSASVCAGSGCGGRTVDVSKAESAAKAFVAKSTGAVIKSVRCPSGIPLKKSAAFTCVATEADGTTGSVLATQTDDTGDVELSPPDFPSAAGMIDTAKAESATKALVAGSTGADVKSVSCPGSVVEKQGATFTCVATGADGTTASVLITQTNSAGNVHISAPTLLHTGPAAKLIARGLESKLKFSVEVTCPDLISAHKGTTMTCEASHAGGAAQKVLVTVTDANGDIAYRVE